MPFKFEKLKVWNKALDLTIEMNEIARPFPNYELYNLSSQIRRASDLVVLNIAEGCTAQSKPEFKRFLNYSMRSAIEVVSCLFIARRKNYINNDCFSKYYQAYEQLCKMIRALKSSLD